MCVWPPPPPTPTRCSGRGVWRACVRVHVCELTSRTSAIINARADTRPYILGRTGGRTVWSMTLRHAAQATASRGTSPSSSSSVSSSRSPTCRLKETGCHAQTKARARSRNVFDDGRTMTVVELMCVCVFECVRLRVCESLESWGPTVSRHGRMRNVTGTMGDRSRFGRDRIQ